jgi:predicted dehydrogenase
VLAAIPEAQVVAFCDQDIGRAGRAAEPFDGASYADLEEMLDREALHALYVCVPPHEHNGQEEMAARRGIALFVEKPLAADRSTAERILSAIGESGVISSVGYHFRYFEATDRLREALAGQTVGIVLGYWMASLPGSPWFRRMAESGGQVNVQATHMFDLARFVVGSDIVEVYAAAATRALGGVPGLDIPDVGAVTVKFANGVVGNLSHTCLIGSAPGRVGLSVYAPDLVAKLERGQLQLRRAADEQTISPGDDPYLRQNRVFIEAVRTGDASAIRSPYADAFKTFAATQAAIESAASGQPVRVRSSAAEIKRSAGG